MMKTKEKIIHQSSKFIFLIFFLSVVSCSEEKESYYSNGKIKSRTIYTDKYTNKYTIYEYYESGNLRGVSEMQKGMMQGKSEKYYSNGIVKGISEWKKNNQHGRAMAFYENGKLQSLSFYKNGKLDSLSLIYSSEGKILQNQYFSSDTLFYATHYQDSKIVAGGVLPIAITEKDTILLGEKYTLKIKFGFKMKGILDVSTGIIDLEDNFIQKTNDFENLGNNVFFYSFTPSKRGVNILPIYVSHKTLQNDTLIADGALLKHRFYVK